MRAFAAGATGAIGARLSPSWSREYEHRTVSGGVGHNLPQEAPEAFADAVLEVGGRVT
jgi:hypothetical protein